MKKIVVSGVNMTQGGLLSIFQDCLDYINKNLKDEYEVIALVNSKELFSSLNLDKKIKLIEFPESKKSWLKRCWYEYYYFRKLSKKIKPYLWLSLHDMTPNVVAEKRVVYCHNATPFFKMKLREIKYDKKIFLFSKLYKYLYKINIKKNDYIIVQQNWIAQKFQEMYSISNILVVSPLLKEKQSEKKEIVEVEKNSFFYPSIPRFYKNFEIICEAVQELEKKGINDFKIYLTLKAGEGKYADEIYKKYRHLKNVNFIGMISRKEVFKYYSKVEYLIFPSKLETWGLPLSEFSNFNKIILSSDLDYAHETLANHSKKIFFNPENKIELAKLIEKLILKDKKLKFSMNIENNNLNNKVYKNLVGWNELFINIL